MNTEHNLSCYSVLLLSIILFTFFTLKRYSDSLFAQVRVLRCSVEPEHRVSAHN